MGQDSKCGVCRDRGMYIALGKKGFQLMPCECCSEGMRYKAWLKRKPVESADKE